MKLLFVSLGCDKNLVDSEEMLGLLTGNGFEIVDDETEAEAIVVNTCCFINDAKEESVNTILEMAEYKKTGSCKVLVVTGCMAQRYKNEIIEEVPEVDAVLGTTSYGDILKAIREAMEGKHFQEFKDIDYLPEIIENPDYVGVNPNENDKSIEFIKKYSKNVLVGVKLEKDGQYLYVSSMYDIQDSKISRRLYSGRIKNANIDNDENK